MPLIDIHCHIMPGVDDGARDEDMSLAMLRIAAAEGIEHVILTPHHKPGHRNVSAASIVARTKQLQARCNEQGIKVALHTGCELFYYQEALPMIEKREIAPLAGSRGILVEFYPGDSFSTIRSAVYDLLSAGCVPVIAHVERYAEVTQDFKRVGELYDMGAKLQVNALTITGHYGRGLKSFAKHLLKEGLVHFVATDAHNLETRAPRLKEAYRYVAAKTTSAYAEKIFHDNALQLIKGNV